MTTLRMGGKFSWAPDGGIEVTVIAGLESFGIMPFSSTVDCGGKVDILYILPFLWGQLLG